MESNMEERKWDELKRDCLVEILARVGTESLTDSIPFVCKSWYNATLDPQCWRTLNFTDDTCSDNFVKFAVGRSQRSATVVAFRSYCFVSDEALLCISEGCPVLKSLILPDPIVEEKDLLISNLIGSWKNLEYLTICSCIYFKQILESIAVHCNNFIGFDCCRTVMGEKEVSWIVELTPKIKFLRMKSAGLPRTCLVMILKGCRELEMLDVSNCWGFEEDDDEILQLASHIKSFNCSGAMLEEDDYDYDYDFDVSYRDSVLFDDEYNSD